MPSSTLLCTASADVSAVGQQAVVTLQTVKDVRTKSGSGLYRTKWNCRLPCTSQSRKEVSMADTPLSLQDIVEDAPHAVGGGPENPDTVLYLAYGSNLCAETFQGRRGIRPVSQVNVVVPELVMTFDLPGIPYVEPCFANTRYRKQPDTKVTTEFDSEKTPLLTPIERRSDYHKTRWHKGLVGVVYEVTKSDYAHIIATEGGGASYQDVIVDCYELPPNVDTVPNTPTSQPFKAHTLFSPALPPDAPPKKGGRFTRPDPDYAQASARYLKLITDGADEHSFPQEYKIYLHELRPYTITSAQQRLGQFVFLMLWFPIISFVFATSKMFADDKGRSPAWFAELAGAVFKAMWASYDGLFKDIFGDGERTVDKDEDEDGVALRRKNALDRYGSLNEKIGVHDIV